jgi:mRNA-degrading endonuclease toxin of MazEF toxin-antitoxin module
VQRIVTVARAKLERRLGELTHAEMEIVLGRLAERLKM